MAEIESTLLFRNSSFKLFLLRSCLHSKLDGGSQEMDVVIFIGIPSAYWRG